jgi:hypothetical protein
MEVVGCISGAQILYLIHIRPPETDCAMLNRLLGLAAFQNPEFYKAQKMRLSTYAKPRVIACGEDFAEHVTDLLVQGEAKEPLKAGGLAVQQYERSPATIRMTMSIAWIR